MRILGATTMIEIMLVSILLLSFFSMIGEVGTSMDPGDFDPWECHGLNDKAMCHLQGHSSETSSSFWQAQLQKKGYEDFASWSRIMGMNKYHQQINMITMLRASILEIIYYRVCSQRRRAKHYP